MLGTNREEGEVSVKAVITIEGHDYIREFIRNNEQHESILTTNQSIKLLNDAIPNINRRQEILTKVTLGVVILSLIAIGLTAYYSSKAPTSEDFMKVNRTLRDNHSDLNGIQKAQTAINSSLSKMVSDSAISGSRAKLKVLVKKRGK